MFLINDTGIRIAGVSSGGGMGGLAFGTPFIIPGPGFGTKLNQTLDVWDYGQAGVGVLDSQWDGAHPSTVPGGVGNYKNYAPGTNEIAVPHPHCQAIRGGVHCHAEVSSLVGGWVDWNVSGGITYPFYISINHYCAVDPRFLFNLSGTDWNWKKNVYGTSGGGISGDSWYEELVSGNGPDNPPISTDGAFFDNVTPPQAHVNDDGGSFDQPTNTWYGTDCLNPIAGDWVQCEHLYKISQTANGGFIRSWENGSQVLNVSNRTDAISGIDRSIQVGAYARQYTDPAVAQTQWRYHAVSAVFIDPNPGRFIMGNNSSIALCTIREPQPPFSWVDGSVGININQGRLGAGTWPIHYLNERDGNRANVALVTVTA